MYAVIDQTPDVRSVRLARPKGFDFRAGQHLTVALRVDGERVSRRVPISSAPESIGYLEITLHRRGPVSGALYASMEVDRLLAVRPPSGSFVYPEGDDRPLLLVAGGIGCAPLMSMLRHAVESDPTRPVTFLLSVQAEQDIVFRRDLALLRRLHPRPRIAVTLTRESRPGYLSGRIGEEMLRRAAPDPASTIFCLCGPPPMVDEVRRVLGRLGVPPGQVRWEVLDQQDAASAPALAAAPRWPPAREHAPARAPDRSRAAAPVPARTASPAVPSRTVAPTPSRAAAGGRVAPVADVGGEASAPSQTLSIPRKAQFQQILRFAKGEMMLHWSIAVPFMVCFASGITMKLLYNLRDPSVFREVLSVTHRVAGCALAILPPLAIARNWRDYKVHIYNLKVGFSWTVDDLKWLFLVGPATVSKRIVLPEQRKFNAAERLNFMMVTITYPLFLLTGFALWIDGSHHFMPWVIHISMSLTAPLLMMGHIYMAVVNPDTRVGLSGMFTGRVDREWAKHHYRRWYAEHFEEDGRPKA